MSSVASRSMIGLRIAVVLATAPICSACAQPDRGESHLVPAAFRGEWNADVAACGTGSSESTLRIGADSIWGYESGGRLTDISRRGDAEFTATAHLSGEGEEWSTRIHLALSADGNTLKVLGPGSRGFSRQRCP